MPMHGNITFIVLWIFGTSSIMLRNSVGSGTPTKSSGQKVAHPFDMVVIAAEHGGATTRLGKDDYRASRKTTQTPELFDI